MDCTIEQIGHNSHAEENLEYSLKEVSMKECRICLQNREDPEDQLFSPCDCTGSLKYVHHSCMETWISKLVSNTSKTIDSDKAYIACELCSGRISFNLRETFKCKTKEQIQTTVKTNIKMLIALVALLLINMGFFFAILYYLLKYGFKKLYKNSEVLVSLLLSGGVIFSIVTVTIVCVLVRKFFLTKRFIVWNVSCNNTVKCRKVHK